MKAEQKPEQKSEKNKLCFSKKIVIFALVMYFEAVVFGQVAMWHFGNLDSLSDMWINIVPPIIAIIAYYIKAAKENCKGGIVYDKALEKPPEMAAEKPPEMATEEEEADG